MEFYQTQTGRKLLEQTLPQIADALRDVAKALRAPAPRIQLSGDVPEDFFKDLFFGNYDPDESPQSEEARRYKDEILSCQREIHAAVPPDLWEQIDRSYSLLNLRETESRIQAFAAGYRTAVTMIMAGLSRDGGKSA